MSDDNNNKFGRGLKFALPIALIMWSLFVWLMLAIFSEVAP